MKKNKICSPAEQLRKNFRDILKIKKIAGDASERDYYRLFFRNYSLIAMVYREPEKEEIAEIIRLSGIYKENGINVPEVVENINDQILIQEDLGNISIQRFFRGSLRSDREKILRKISCILKNIKNIPVSLTQGSLDLNRMRWEINFFFDHFIKNIYPSYKNVDALKNEIFGQLEKIEKKFVFTHRDFHSRNMYYFKDEIYLIDFQDSLRAPELYDLASFFFDSYLDLKERDLFLGFFRETGTPDKEQLYLTAFQRNLKALGTFGFQTYVKKNRKFEKYIKRTLKHIKNNPVLNRAPELEKLFFGKDSSGI